MTYSSLFLNAFYASESGLLSFLCFKKDVLCDIKGRKQKNTGVFPFRYGSFF